MPISGLAITLSVDEARALSAQQAMADEQRVEIGPRNGRRLAATIETASQDEDRRLREWMTALDGVEHIDIVFIHFDDADDREAPSTCAP